MTPSHTGNYRWAAAASLVIAAAMVAPVLFAQSAPRPSAEAGARDFLEIAKVLQSPRCKNCHPSGDRPLRGDKGLPHAMNVSRRSPEAGLLCTTCHRAHNTSIPGGPPGVTGWRMPRAETPMVFEGKTPGELCRQLVDPKQNGGKTAAAIGEHLDHDELVLWGWQPGPGRTTPPLSHAELMTHVRGWLAAGTPCPP